MINSKFWHQNEKNKAHSEIFDHVQGVLREQEGLHVQNLAHAQFYSCQNEPGLHGDSTVPRWDAINDNIIANVIDTATSLIGISKTKVSFNTTGARYNLKTLAKQLEQLCFSMFQHLSVYEKCPQIFRDACIFGTGVLKIYRSGNKVKVERILIDNIVVDEQEVPYGGLPPQLHQINKMSRAAIMAKFPKADPDLLQTANSSVRPEDYAELRSVDADQVAIVESWLLPVGDKPGRHVICHSGETLLDEEYRADFYPFVFFDWKKPLTGWYGRSLAAGLLGFQIALNELNDFVRQVHHLIVVPRVFMNPASMTMKAKLDNTIGAIIPSVGGPPTFFTPQGLNAETYNYKDSIRTNAFEWAGISKMAAMAVRPEGIEAGVALRELSDNQSQRFAESQSRYEDMHIQVGVQILRIVKEIVKSGASLPEIESEPFLAEIDWDLVDFDKHMFRLRVMPASILGETPAGKKQTIIEFAQYGVQLDQNELRRLLDNPDIQASDTVHTAKERYAEWVVQKLRQGEWPDIEVAFVDPVKLANVVTAEYLDAVVSEEDESVLEIMRQWLHTLQAEVQAAQQPTQLPGQGPLPEDIPAGNIAETGLPGVVGPTADTAQTMLPGLVPSGAPIAT